MIVVVLWSKGGHGCLEHPHSIQLMESWIGCQVGERIYIFSSQFLKSQQICIRNSFNRSMNIERYTFSLFHIILKYNPLNSYCTPVVDVLTTLHYKIVIFPFQNDNNENNLPNWSKFNFHMSTIVDNFTTINDNMK